MTTVIDAGSQTPTEEGDGAPPIKALNGSSIERFRIINIRRDTTRCVVMTFGGEVEVSEDTYRYLERLFAS